MLRGVQLHSAGFHIGGTLHTRFQFAHSSLSFFRRTVRNMLAIYFAAVADPDRTMTNYITS